MLREEAVAILSEQSSECIGNPIQNAKLKKWCHFPKNDPNDFIFGQKLDIDKTNLFWEFGWIWGSLWRHYDVIPELSQIWRFGPNLLTSADHQVKIGRWKPFLSKDQSISYKMRGQPTFYLILFKSCGRDKFGPIKEQYPSLRRQSDDVIMTSSPYW